MDTDDIFNEGYEAYFNGIDIDKCPYQLIEKQQIWNDGWYAGYAYHEYEEQQYRGM